MAGRSQDTSHVEEEMKAIVKNADMSQEMEEEAVHCAADAIEKFKVEKEIAAYIKREFDKRYTPSWHCVVGRQFGSFLSHQQGCFIYFILGERAFLLFKGA